MVIQFCITVWKNTLSLMLTTIMPCTQLRYHHRALDIHIDKGHKPARKQHRPWLRHGLKRHKVGGPTTFFFDTSSILTTRSYDIQRFSIHHALPIYADSIQHGTVEEFTRSLITPRSCATHCPQAQRAHTSHKDWKCDTFCIFTMSNTLTRSGLHHRCEATPGIGRVGLHAW